MIRPPAPLSVAIGRAARGLTRLRGGSGSAFPGLLVEKLDPQFLARALAKLPRGVVVVSGTNGKTTTTKMVVELLRGQGLKVFTNSSGSNFTRGVVASVLGEASFTGRLDADIAVLELDEAHAVHFVRAVNPDYSLLLNVMRDQLDRFGEIDATAGLLRTIAEHTTKGVVLNREDARVRAIADSLHSQQIRYFGLAPELRKLFPSDDEMHSADSAGGETPPRSRPDAAAPAITPEDSASGGPDGTGGETPDNEPVEPAGTGLISTPAEELPEADVLLTGLQNRGGSFRLGSKDITTELTVNGAYNTYNAAAALALVRQVLGADINDDALISSLAQVAPAFGRGESLTVGGQPLDLVLVKNPAGFRLGLSSFSAEGVATMIAINDNYADGRDMSWLWDVSFDSLAAGGVKMVSGVRAYDMGLRLAYDDVDVTALEPNLKSALEAFLAAHPEEPKRIFCTYTAMLALRKHLSAYTEVEGF
ncbi:MurT ligase domain-containing protein [Nesterenkonia massiliensis]|uniref:Lipid II isoglutaminyl synthase (glutamine-hydrolyzing) subunit MurT n=1 Tax=Nesterenkonia massiliensis TaxID=1232429 RepID=A0ABT2HQJ1_9MICC|nr:MurT ligase domain-containing protein [Nesterenkonia massiliensis]